MHQNEEGLFRSWHWGECIEMLDGTVQHSDAIVLVSSVSDSGKTTLKQEFVNLLGPHFKVFSMYGDPRLGVVSLMRQVTLGFNLPWDHNVPPDWSEIRKAIFSQIECRWILCVDDAEKLSWDALNALINLYTTINAEGSQFSLILFADLSLEDSLKNSVLKDFFENKFQIIHLKPLSLEQMTTFIRDHMDLTFDRKTLKKLYLASNGIIGKVKQLATSELNRKGAGENIVLKNLLANITNPPAIRIAVCCSLLIVAYVLFSITQKKDDVFTRNEEPQLVAQEDTTTNIAIELIPTDVSVTTTTSAATHTHVAATAPVINTANNHAVVENTNYEQLYQKLHTDLTHSLQKQLQNQLQEELTKLEHKIAAITSLAANKAIEPSIEKPEKLIEQATVTPETTKVINNQTIITSNKINPNSHKSSEKHLLSVAKNRYVIQLMASKHEQSIKNLIVSHPKLSKKIKYFSTKFKPNQEQVWFVAVHGSYANRQLALNDIKTLPKGLQKLKPIVRDYGYVHKLINNK